MQNAPLVSLVIITMNHEKFIEKACQSAISQTYPNLEIILLDNCSLDNTYQIAQKTLENATIPTQQFRNEHSFGIAKNLNFLISKTSGDLVCILSGDDWFPPNSIEEKVKYFANNKVDVLLTDGYRFIENEQQIVDAYSVKMKKRIMDSIPNFFYENVTQNLPINVGVMVKKQLLQQHPFDEAIHAEDWDMNLRLTALGYKVGFLDKKLFYYRILPKSLSSNWELMEDAYKKVTDKYQNFILSNKKLSEKYHINLLKHHYEKRISQTENTEEKNTLKKIWKQEKAKVKYRQPLLFFKLLWIKLKN